MASSTSLRTQSAPMPVGPSILWAENAKKSQPSEGRSTFMCGTACAPSIITRAPAFLAREATARASVMVPSTLDMRLNVTSLARPDSRCASSWSMSRFPSSSTPTYSSLAPFSFASSCQGTMLLWCSYSVVITASPSPTWGRPHAWAARFMASVVPRTKTSSETSRTPRNRATAARAPS